MMTAWIVTGLYLLLAVGLAVSTFTGDRRASGAALPLLLAGIPVFALGLRHEQTAAEAASGVAMVIAALVAGRWQDQRRDEPRSPRPPVRL